jgi:hypothetical protein
MGQHRSTRLVSAVLIPLVFGLSAGAALAAANQPAPKAADCTFDTCQFPGFCKAADYAEFCAGESGSCYSEECH